ncbi:hypothetical protein [Symmachiella macrocystis]|nr:hypothetical protein [Symmachiella macrocystis]
MFIEPGMKVGTKRVFFPDIVICNTREVIAVIEIKYQPRALPSHDKDLETLRILARNRRRVSVSNTRFRGPAVDAKNYPMSEDVLFVWAGIHKKPQTSYESEEQKLLSHRFRVLDDCFLQLHAETDHLKRPSVFSRVN